jgi:hypothetical protein
MTFDSDQVTHRLSHQVSFDIKVKTMGKNIVALWSMKEPQLSSCLFLVERPLALLISTNISTMLKSFDRHMFHPHAHQFR